MFMVSAPAPVQHSFCGHAPRPSTSFAASADCEGLSADSAASASAAGLQPKLSTISNTSTTSFGGLRRVVSSLQSAKPCFLANPEEECCVVEAKQVEMEVASLTAHPFYLTICAPNGELAERLKFPAYGAKQAFQPRQSGCGHGNWTFVVERKERQAEKSKMVVVGQQKFYLDGVGTLFFTVDDQLTVKLSSQEFLRLPSASQCCSRKNSKKL